ncbi:MAG: hypothetical protein H6811_06080 [Phycisphaeraceae bacterium]|nr:hypothetical protein [Phycisphaeraceae bacterium]
MRLTHWFLIAVLAAGVVGCSGSRGGASTVAESDDSSRGSLTPSRPDPSEPTRSDDDSAPDEPEVTGGGELTISPPVAVASDGGSTPPQAASTGETDTPPTWWTSEPLHENGQVGVTAQATAESLRAARKLAVDRGLTRLESLVGREVDKFEVWPAVARPGPDGRFTVFVMVRASEEP